MPTAPAFIAAVALLFAAHPVASAQPATRPGTRPRSPVGIRGGAAFVPLTTADGLAHDHVRAFARDRYGFLWVGTAGGLSRYDGYEFVTLRPEAGDPHALGGGFVWAVEEADGGDLWVGTDGGGASRYDPTTGTLTTYRYDAGDATSLCGDEVLSLAAGASGGVWLGTTLGVCYYDPVADAFERFEGEPLGALRPYSAIGILEASDGAVWVAAGGYGLFRYDPASGELTAFEHDPADPDSPPWAWAVAVEEGPDGTVWVGYNKGLLRWDPATGRTTRYEVEPGGLVHPYVRALAPTPEGAVWVGTWGGGLQRFDPATGRWTTFHSDPAGLPSDDVIALHLDREGVLWVGTDGDGMARTSPRGASFSFLRFADATVGEEASHLPAQAVAEGPDGGVWVGTPAGLVRLDPSTGAYSFPPPGFGCPADEEVTALAGGAGAGRSGTSGPSLLWTGYGNGGVCATGTAAEARPQAYERSRTAPDGLLSNVVRSLALGPRGAVWVGLDEGLDRIDPAARRVRHHRLYRADSLVSDPSVRAVLATEDGDVWAGTDGNGLFRLSPGGTLRTYVHEPGDAGTLASNAVADLAVGPAGGVWVATDVGVDRIDPETGRVLRLGPRDGLPEAGVSALLWAGDVLWAATTRGLARIEGVAHIEGSGGPDSVRVAVYDHGDGLPVEAFVRGAALLTRDGARGGLALFGSRGGLLAFRPGEVTAASDAAPVVVTELEVFGGEAELEAAVWAAETATLGPGDDDFALTYAALDLASAPKIRYRYRLGGVDEGWVEAGRRRFVSYANVPPGTYVFRVQATTPGGAWGETATLRIVRLPHWWQTWPFRLLALAALVIVGVALYRWRVRSLLAVERTRHRIADDLHDDVGSRVSSIALAVEIASRSPALPEAERERLDTTAASARALVADLRDVIWVVDSGADRLPALFERVRDVAHRMLREVPHRVVVPEAVPNVELDIETRRDVLLVLKEALHNALRHAGATAIEVEAAVHGDAFVIEVRDDGRGIAEPDERDAPRDVVGRGRGLTTMRARAERLGGRLAVERRPGGGTRIALTVPLP